MGDKVYPPPPIWLLIDGTNCVHRDFWGVGNDPSRVTDVFARRLSEMIDYWKPACVVTAWDCGPSFRNDLYPAYKAGRKKLEGITECIELAKARCLSLGVGRIQTPGFEADDILATLCDFALADGCRVVVYSNDKDLHQVIREGEVCQLLRVQRIKGRANTNHLEFTWRNARDLMVEYHVTPDQWVDYKCLVGDPSDNLPGVPNIGPQTAGRLLHACGSIDGFYAAPFKAAISDKQRAILMNAKPKIPMYRELSALRRDVPLPEMWREAC